jgi:nucleoid-associated protein YgaU
MIPITFIDGRRAHWRTSSALWLAAVAAGASPAAVAPAASAAPAAPVASAAPVAPAAPVASAAPVAPTAPVAPASCLESGDGYFRARLAGAIEANIDWPNSGTLCEGESRNTPPGVRLSFQRVPSGASDLLFVIGLSGVREGRPGREMRANLTIIVQGTDRFFGTLGDSRCTVDSLSQRRLGSAKVYRVEARGFCTQPAHAVRGDGAVLMSTFEFAGVVRYDPPETDVGAENPAKMTP